jgi:hypothetical protein
MCSIEEIGERCSVSDNGLEAPDADVAEQEMDAVPKAEDTNEPPLPSKWPLEANEADASEQAREVRLDEDDEYR